MTNAQRRIACGRGFSRTMMACACGEDLAEPAS